jgi:hypothetical protein
LEKTSSCVLENTKESKYISDELLRSSNGC